MNTEYLEAYFEGLNLVCDIDKTDFTPPKWLDIEKCKRGQEFALKHLPVLIFAEYLTLMLIYTPDAVVAPLLYTGKSSTPFAAFNRYFSTIKRVKTWYNTDIWDSNSEGAKNIRITRKMHKNIRTELSMLPNDELKEICTIKNISCPFYKNMLKKLNTKKTDAIKEFDKRLENNYDYFSHSSMASTQIGFVGLLLLHPEKFGLRNCKKRDLEAFAHTWAGNYDEVYSRISTVIDRVLKPKLGEISYKWEFLMRNILEGLNFACKSKLLCSNHISVIYCMF